MPSSSSSSSSSSNLEIYLSIYKSRKETELTQINCRITKSLKKALKQVAITLDLNVEELASYLLTEGLKALSREHPEIKIVHEFQPNLLKQLQFEQVNDNEWKLR